MNRAGMTLLELVVALTITSAALAAGYGAFAGVLDRREAVAAATDALTRAAGARQLLAAWIAGARVGLANDGPHFRGLDGVAGASHDDELTFITDAETPVGAHATLVRISVDRDPATAERGLTAALTPWNGAAVTRIVLAPEVDGLDVRYASRVFGGVRWLPSWISRSVLPGGVEIILAPAAGDTLPPLLAVPITVLLGDGR
jgi:prepilin-type N-terminal cleavage/methylation domain-containing protein